MSKTTKRISVLIFAFVLLTGLPFTVMADPVVDIQPIKHILGIAGVTDDGWTDRADSETEDYINIFHNDYLFTGDASYGFYNDLVTPDMGGVSISESMAFMNIDNEGGWGRGRCSSVSTFQMVATSSDPSVETVNVSLTASAENYLYSEPNPGVYSYVTVYDENDSVIFKFSNRNGTWESENVSLSLNVGTVYKVGLSARVTSRTTEIASGGSRAGFWIEVTGEE
ncbi:MAG: hypothetical protein GY795_25930 [Desulfobacterales bacterium]|nr:hypothetical protein [Desulfobacterales bacterium]